MGKFIELGIIAVIGFGFLVGLGVGVAYLMGWSYVHDKLRFERKQDSKEKEIGG